MATLQHKTLESPLKEIQALPVSWFVKRLKDQTLYMLDMKNCDVINISAQVTYHANNLSYRVGYIVKGWAITYTHDRRVTTYCISVLSL